MKRFILLPIFLLVFFACKSKKETKTITPEQHKIETEQIDQNHQSIIDSIREGAYIPEYSDEFYPNGEMDKEGIENIKESNVVAQNFSTDEMYKRNMTAQYFTPEEQMLEREQYLQYLNSQNDYSQTVIGVEIPQYQINTADKFTDSDQIDPLDMRFNSYVHQ